VPPVAKSTLGELHDVALVHEGYALASVPDGVVEGGADESFRAFTTHRLDPDAGGLWEADLLDAHLALEERDDPFRLLAFGGPLDARVDVFGVLAEDHHVHLLGRPDRGRHTLEVAHRAQADIEIEGLAQSNVERPDPATDRRRQWTLDAHEVVLERRD